MRSLLHIHECASVTLSRRQFPQFTILRFHVVTKDGSEVDLDLFGTEHLQIVDDGLQVIDAGGNTVQP